MLLVAGYFPTSPGWNISSSDNKFRDTISWVRGGSPQPFPPRVLDEHKLRTAEVCVGRSIFVAEEAKYVGLGPKESRPGDSICILLGGNVPYLLRPRTSSALDDAGNKTWEFIGECYVRGIMDGEAMDQISDRTVEYTDFEIR